MRISLNGWHFDVDITRTMIHSAEAAQGHCTCGYCRNFYRAIDATFGSIKGFLAQIGANIEVPEMLLPLDPTVYFAAYRVWGHVLQKGMLPLTVDGIPLRIDEQGDSFLICAGPMELPWVIEEAMEDVVSPVNDPEVFWEMFDYFLPDAVLDS